MTLCRNGSRYRLNNPRVGVNLSDDVIFGIGNVEIAGRVKGNVFGLVQQCRSGRARVPGPSGLSRTGYGADGPDLNGLQTDFRL